MDLVGGTEIVSVSDCWEMLATQSIGRLAVSLDGRIDVFPVNYGLDGDGILFRTNAGRKRAWADSGEVVFEVDWVDERTRCGWSVVVRGTAQEVSGLDGPEGGAPVEPWAGHKNFLLRITPRSITGRRVGPG